MTYAVEGSLARRWRRLVRFAADPGRLTRGLAGIGAVDHVRARPGSLEASVRGSQDEAYQVVLAMDVVGPAWRSRWLAAMGIDGEGPVPMPDDPRAEAAARSGLDPLPAPGAVHPRCTCPDVAPAGWCKHACAVAETAALALDGDDPLLLWRARGIVSLARGPGDDAALPAAQTPEPADGREAGSAEAFWGSEGRLPRAALEAWTDEPAAMARLGPLPTARGQQAAAEPVLTHYRRVRDALAALFANDTDGVSPRAKTRRTRAKR